MTLRRTGPDRPSSLRLEREENGTGGEAGRSAGDQERRERGQPAEQACDVEKCDRSDAGRRREER